MSQVMSRAMPQAMSQVMPPRDDGQALGRLMTFYAAAVTLATAIATANPIVTPEQPEPDIALPDLPDFHAATTWLDSEPPNIVGLACTTSRVAPRVVDAAASTG